MSRQLITEYRSELDRIHAASGSKRESVIREAFKDLLKRRGKSRDLIFLAEHEYLTPTGDRRYIDGALVHSIRVPCLTSLSLCSPPGVCVQRDGKSASMAVR